MEKQSVQGFVERNISDGSYIKADKFKSYHWLNDGALEYEPVRTYSQKETLSYLPWAHIMIGNIKGIIKGVHHGVSSKHLNRLLCEYSYRFNRRFMENNMFVNLIAACANTYAITFAEPKT